MSGDSSVDRPRSRFRADVRGQSETIAVVLILALTVFGTGAIIMLGSGALADAKETSRIQSTEHAMTLFDSRSAMVALGDSSRQSVDLSRSSGGSYAVRDGGWIRIEHRNFSGKGDHEVIYDAALGAVTYENGGTEIAYEGGGVWRREGGGTVMVSPPEFHYRDATLTLPVVRVSGDGSATGGRVEVSSAGRTRRVFPNATEPTPDVNETGAPYNGTDWPYANPVRNGHINITVHSDYYEGWAQYFDTRTEGNVTVDDANRTTTVQLITAESVGAFRMPNEGNGVEVRGIAGGHPVQTFTMTLKGDNGGSDFNNLHWSLYSDTGGEEFEFHVAANGRCKSGDYDSTLDVSVYYSDESNGLYEGWQNQSVNAGDPGSDEDFVVDCENETLTMNLRGDTNMSYGRIDTTGSDNKWHFGPEIKEGTVPGTTFDQHYVDDETEYVTDDEESLEFLMDHYFGLLSPNFDLTVADGPGGSSRVDEGGSYGELQYVQTTDSRYITYLHITENEVRVEFE